MIVLEVIGAGEWVQYYIYRDNWNVEDQTKKRGVVTGQASPLQCLSKVKNKTALY
jgi:hypothetical protein